MLAQAKPTIVASLLKYMFIFSTIAFIVCLLCVALHYMGVPIFSFVEGEPGVLRVPVPTTEQSVFVNAPITSDLSCNFLPVAPTGYTISFDTFLIGDFITTTVPRVLLYRSPYPIALQTTDTTDSLSSLFSNSNIIVFVDPLKNDLYAAVLKSDSTYTISEPIKNIPLRTPFRVTLVVSDNFLEVYLNGDLKQVLTFNGEIISTLPSNYFFGPPPIVNQSVKIGNIHIWNSELSSKIVRSFGKGTNTSKLFGNL